MTLTTHEWAVFWSIAVPCNQNYRQIRECSVTHGLAIACKVLVTADPEPMDVDGEAMFAAVFDHLVTMHDMEPTTPDRFPRNIPNAGPTFGKVLTRLAELLPDRFG